MGICLDTEQNHAAQTDGGRERGLGEGPAGEMWSQEAGGDFRFTSTPPDGHFPMHNGGKVHFEAPRVPVIFVLGGPGSGKVTHCDNLMQEKKGIIHINMTDLLQQYAIGNAGCAIHNSVIRLSQDMQDFSQLSSRTVTEVLMLEMKMAPAAKTYLISGYPRSMRDVVEYSEKIQVVNGVILISWRQKVLERQIDYGAKLGQVVLSLARMELNNFFKNVMPVADYFDQSNMLIAVNGERHPGDVYKDFRAAVMRILGQQDNPPVFANGKVATVPADVYTEQLPTRDTAVGGVPSRLPRAAPGGEVITVTSRELEQNYSSPVKPGWPPVLWVIGGPGSNKAALCQQAVKQNPGWVHISLGRLLRAAADTSAGNGGGPPGGDNALIRQCIVDGELVPLPVIIQTVESHMASNMSAAGVILDGFPRNMHQATEFENKFKQQPTLILLDCSKLQLGRGRLDDSVSAFRRRLEIFREHSLPMLKAMDNVGRLTIVDGDTDTTPVQEDFNNVVKQHLQYIKDAKSGDRPSHVNHGLPNGNAVLNGGNRMVNGHAANGHIANGHLNRNDATLQDLEAVTELETISKRVQGNIANGNGVVNRVSNGVNHLANGYGHMMNGHPPNGTAVGNGFVNGNGKYSDLDAARRENIRNLYQGIPIDSHI